MLKNYLLIALRNLLKNKLYSFINITGLAIGLAATLLILLFIRDETGYDTWIPNHENIYRMHSSFAIPGRPIFTTTRSAGGLGWDMPAALPEVEHFARIAYTGATGLKNGESFTESFGFVDPTFFNVFDLPFIYGDRELAFQNNNSIVITETAATKYFGSENPLGRPIEFIFGNGFRGEMVVSGVIEDLPENTHLSLNMVAPIVREQWTSAGFMFESLTSVNVFSYFAFTSGNDIKNTDQKVQQYIDEALPIPAGQLPPEIELASDFYDLSFMPIADIHLEARDIASDGGDIKPLGDSSVIYAFSVVAILILSIASINFMNLSTARSAIRAREVSLRKVVGAERKQLIVQFIGESVILALLSCAISLALVELLLPTYNAILDKNLALDFLKDPILLPIALGISLVTGIISGIYPALILSGYRPSQILRANKSSQSAGISSLRNFLVVIQFAISICLAIVTGVVYAQTQFAKNADLGFEQENKIIVRNFRNQIVGESAEALVNEWKQIPGITGAVYSSEAPTDNRENNTSFAVMGSENQNAILTYISIEEEFFDLYGVEPIYGRDFSKDFISDEVSFPEDETLAGSGALILNESAATRLGFVNAEDAIGSVITEASTGRTIEYTVVGIVPDINFRSIRYGLQPTVYFVMPRQMATVTLQVSENNVTAVLPAIEQAWKRHIPLVPFNYDILDTMIDLQYANEDAQSKVFSGFAILSTVIACLGLFGLSSFAVSQRTKEIGIRKILGASVREIVQLLIWQFSRPVLLANLIALPIAAWFLSDWLQGFEYRISEIYIVLFGVISAAVALIIAWGTVSSQAIRVARANPIFALRYE